MGGGQTLRSGDCPNAGISRHIFGFSVSNRTLNVRKCYENTKVLEKSSYGGQVATEWVEHPAPPPRNLHGLGARPPADTTASPTHRPTELACQSRGPRSRRGFPTDRRTPLRGDPPPRLANFPHPALAGSRSHLPSRPTGYPDRSCRPSSSRIASPTYGSSILTPTWTGGAGSTRHTGGRGFPWAERWCRATAPIEPPVRWSGSITTSTRRTTGCARRVRPGSSCTTCAAGHRRGRHGGTGDQRGQLPWGVHPPGRGSRLRVAQRSDDHIPGRQLLQPRRRARRGMGRSRHRRRVGGGRSHPVRPRYSATPVGPTSPRPGDPTPA